jgi:hypothetical protein
MSPVPFRVLGFSGCSGKEDKGKKVYLTLIHIESLMKAGSHSFFDNLINKCFPGPDEEKPADPIHGLRPIHRPQEQANPDSAKQSFALSGFACPPRGGAFPLAESIFYFGLDRES